jgi:putative ABC transport system ATP-binding protein
MATEDAKTPQRGPSPMSPGTPPAIDEQPTQPAWAVGQKPVPVDVTKQATVPHQASTVASQADETITINSEQQGKPVIDVRHLAKTYVLGKTLVPALRDVTLKVYPGEFVVVLGPSGSGKSTFMNVIGCLDRPTSGEYWLMGRLVSKMSSDELANIRNRLIGFVFQGFNLLSRASALKNVELPMIYAGVPAREREQRARKALSLVGLGNRLHHKPAELSGGQQQRVAIARALVNGPAVLLADEPTGNLDSRTSVEIMAVLQELNEQGLTIVLVTHDLNVAAYGKRQVSFFDGRLVRDEVVTNRRMALDEWNKLHAQAEVQAAQIGGQQP